MILTSRIQNRLLALVYEFLIFNITAIYTKLDCKPNIIMSCFSNVEMSYPVFIHNTERIKHAGYYCHESARIAPPGDHELFISRETLRK